MNMRARRFSLSAALLVFASQAGLIRAAATGPADPPPFVTPPVATDEATYLAYGRVYPDPQGCLAHDTDGDGINDVVPPRVSPWAKGNVCVGQYLQFDETIEGAKFMARKFPRYMQVIRLDQAFNNPEFRSAGNARELVIENGTPKALGRDRRPLYLFKVTDAKSPIPEQDRLHFAYGLSIHGIERAGLEGGVRAMEDLVTWAANFPDKKIVEGATEKPVPTAKETLERSVIYFMLANPDGWGRGQFMPVEFQDGSPNVNYRPGVFFQRYNGNGVDMNRDWPTFGYTYRPYSPASEPEVKGFTYALRQIAKQTTTGEFAGGIDLHGQLTANAFSYTLTGGGQRDYRENFLTVDASTRAWADQTARLAWSPYIGTVFPQADQWGTTIDTIGYTVSGDMGSWFESEVTGLGGVGIDNEMSLSHLAPNNVFEPILEQMHIDGNKGLIYSQMASLLTEPEFVYQPSGKIGFVFNPKRLDNEGQARTSNPGLPAQNDIDVIVPCQSAGPQGNDALLPCEEPGVTFEADGTDATLEFDVLGPDRGIWNGGITVTTSHPNAASMSHGTAATLSVERLREDGTTWDSVATAYHQGGTPDLYLPAGQIVTANDPIPGRWRARLNLAGGGPVRVKVDFDPNTAEEDFGQRPFSASSMDFLTDLNKYVKDDAKKLEKVTVEQILADPTRLSAFDTVVVVNDPFPAYADKQGTPLDLPAGSETAYYDALKAFAQGGGNLVLTDGALRALTQMGIVAPGAVGSALGNGESTAQRYEFNVSGRGNVCNNDPLTKDVCLPGTAGGTRRLAVEPTPLGYTPDVGLDGDAEAQLRIWNVNRSQWEGGCGKAPVNRCTSTILRSQTGVGERHIGAGVIRIIGLLLPDPNYAPGGPRDMRFGVASYAPTFSGFQIFLNAVNYQRPSGA